MAPWRRRCVAVSVSRLKAVAQNFSFAPPHPGRNQKSEMAPMLSRLLFVTLPIAGTVAAVLCAIVGSSRAQPPRSSCPQERSVYNVISVSDDADTFRQQMEEFRNHLLIGGTTV